MRRRDSAAFCREVLVFLEETVLLVDDDAALLEVMSIVLSSEGYRVVTAADGAEALKEVGREAGLDLVVLDVMLPRISGFEVLKKIRESSDVPVVMLTAKGQSVDKVVGLELGADDYITKPFDTKELLPRAWRFLGSFGR